MRVNDKKHLKKVLDQIEVQEPSTHFEKRIYQDWQRTVAKTEKPNHGLSEVLVLARLHSKIAALIAFVVIAASVLLGQHLLTSPEEELYRIDALSELSLSTI
ncbi:hypothetical protein [Polynucleobacter sphagniphilus]|jgi:hypothetical protein|uniref:Uncharacterized protein n=1 Tax=Polynucleobacter sphagniphilus TaxID=1743169 RepID=A0AA43MC29_9BURK|nr:hypothetical protein [Polynucleobacter sphagniphilus]MDH6504947.1 hypothetical protein [Polynucleobacter sphagniphilus]MDH6513612.1 hypothetical protein [Polynucleobacter sphagniphilus]